VVTDVPIFWSVSARQLESWCENKVQGVAEVCHQRFYLLSQLTELPSHSFEIIQRSVARDVLYRDENYDGRPSTTMQNIISTTRRFIRAMIVIPAGATGIMLRMFVQPLGDALGELDFLSRKCQASAL